MNGAIPEADLVIIDEAHNLKQGFGDNVSNRNRVMGLAFGHQDGNRYERLHYKPKAKRLLLLSATPFEDNYVAIQRQLEVFGFGEISLTQPGSSEALDITALSNPPDERLQRRIVRETVDSPNVWPNDRRRKNTPRTCIAASGAKAASKSLTNRSQ